MSTDDKDAVVASLAAGGRVPIWLDMHDSEVASLQRPAPLVCMASRLAYLPLAAQQACAQFAEHAPQVLSTTGVWFEHDGQPLRWTLPLGVLVDLHHHKAEQQLPFKVTVRFQGGGTLPCTGEADVRGAFFHSLKQALSLRFGSCRRLMELPQAAQEHEWGCIVRGGEGERRPDLLLLNDEDERPDAQLPLRVVTMQLEQPVVMQARVLLGDVSLGEAVDHVLLANHHQGGGELRVHGVQVPRDAPAKEVWEAMRHPDLFLYVVVVG